MTEAAHGVHTTGPAASSAMQAPEIAAMLAHHEELQSQLRRRVDELAAAVTAGKPFAQEQRAVQEFLSSEVVPHAQAEEDAIYRAGSTRPTLAPLVSGMIMEHEALVALAGRLAKASDGVAGAAIATAFLALFEAHVRKENDLLLPGLLADGAKPAELLADMHRAFEARHAAAASHGESADGELAHGGSGESVIDTREHAAGSCASLATEAFDALQAGGSFVLVADHDPRGIHYMLDAERPGATNWELLEDGPERWQARISRVAAG